MAMMTIANMRKSGVRHVEIHCTVECGHHLDICVDGWDETLEVPLIARRYRCSKCGNPNPQSRPAWHTREGKPFGTL